MVYAIMTRKQYYILLQDQRWKNKASFIRKRDHHTCCRCGKKSHRLQVHHKKYIKGLMPWEYDNSLLESLCSTCHKKEHGIKTKPKKKPVKKAAKPKKVAKKKTLAKRIQIQITRMKEEN
jgi:5-methylcytosine-specific restriction endonuclease McrA